MLRARPWIPFLALAGLVSCTVGQRAYVIRYAVTGTAKSADITVNTPDGVEQRTVTIPYASGLYRFGPGQVTSISAQNDGETGSVTVKIYRGALDDVVKRATSEGAYKIASVSWVTQGTY